MPKVTEEYIRNKKSKIVEAAYNLCLRKTVSAVTMQDIINEAGLSQGGIYRFYRDIDEIFADMGNTEYLNMRTSEYFMEQLRLGRIHPRVSCEELLSFISCAYVGIQMTCIVHNCYKEETDSRTPFYQPDIQLKMLAQTVNYMLGEA